MVKFNLSKFRDLDFQRLKIFTFNSYSYSYFWGFRRKSGYFTHSCTLHDTYVWSQKFLVYQRLDWQFFIFSRIKKCEFVYCTIYIKIPSILINCGFLYCAFVLNCEKYKNIQNIQSTIDVSLVSRAKQCFVKIPVSKLHSQKYEFYIIYIIHIMYILCIDRLL